MSDPVLIKPKERDAVIQSLRAGVVPRTGQHLIQVGRMVEVAVLVQDIERIGGGGSTIRFVIGEYGSGKTFFLNLIRAVALEKKLVTAHADLAPDRRLQATGGQARALYAELMRNLSTRSKSDGGATATVVEKFIGQALNDARERGAKPESIIRERLNQLQEMVGGYDFAEVIACYWQGHDSGNEALKSAAIRWLRGEFGTKTEAKAALGVRTIVDDGSFYDHLKLMARFVRLAGYAGLLVCLDEMVNLFKLAHRQSREANYEQVLRILNDSLQGIAGGLGFALCGTPESLSDPRRGMFSYAALQTRLAENTFAKDGLVDFTGPVIRLKSLSPEDLFVLLQKVRHVYAGGDPGAYLIPDEGIKAFMTHCSTRIGDAYFRTPRSTVREFVNLLAVLEQNRNVSWQNLIGGIQIKTETNPDLEPPTNGDADPQDQSTTAQPAPASNDDLTSFKL